LPDVAVEIEPVGALAGIVTGDAAANGGRAPA
jgi:hypothetical protein